MKLSVPVPVFVTVTVAGDGFVPLPCVALNVSVVVETERVGGAPTVKVTVIVAGEFSAPAAVTVM